MIHSNIRTMWLSKWLLLLSLELKLAATQENLVSCHHSQTGLWYTPNIGKQYFKQTEIAAGEIPRVTSVWKNFPYYIMKLPSDSRCDGRITKLQVCYNLTSYEISDSQVNFVLYKLKENDNTTLQYISNFIYSIDAPNENSTTYYDIQCPILNIVNNKFKLSPSGFNFIGVWVQPPDKVLLLRFNFGEKMDVCRVSRNKNISPTNNISMNSCNKPITAMNAPVLFKMWIDAGKSPLQQAVLGLSVAGGIFFLAFIILSIVMVTWIVWYCKNQTKNALIFAQYKEENCTLNITKNISTRYERDYSIDYKQFEQDNELLSSSQEVALDEDNYVVPPFEEDALYAQLENKIKHLMRASVKLEHSLGSGQFGEVHKGVWYSPQGELDVAIKSLKEGAGLDDKVKFLQEAAIMAQFEDPNVIDIYGVVSAGTPILLVLELLPNGDLLNYLKQGWSEKSGQLTIDGHTLLSYCRQVVSGMVYLSGKGFVHRDLASRNILVSEQGICKIADFGMARDLLYETSTVSSNEVIPVKWSSPEAIHHKWYSIASDVWSFGVVMYEIWSVGKQPFHEFTNNKVISIIDSGFRLPPPPGTPRKIYSLMISCWHPEAATRPSFVDVRGVLSLPDSTLLKMEEQDATSRNPEVMKLGSPLQAAQDLYADLQKVYER